MNITIVGMGLIGGSLARDLRCAEAVSQIYGVDSNPQHAIRAQELHLVDAALALDEAMQKSDVIILAVPVDAILTMLPRILDKIRADQTVVDLGSTKLQIVESIKEHPHRSRYVAAHPMAGTEDSGPDAATDNLFQGKTVLLCDMEHSAPDACKTALEIFRAIGMKFDFMLPDQHDRHAAYVSHLSHVAAYALSLAVQSEEKYGYAVPRLAGGGFTSTVRLAKSSAEMWVPIMQQNRKQILLAIQSFIDQLKLFEECLIKEDYATLQKKIIEANQIRDLL